MCYDTSINRQISRPCWLNPPASQVAVAELVPMQRLTPPTPQLQCQHNKHPWPLHLCWRGNRLGSCYEICDTRQDAGHIALFPEIQAQHACTSIRFYREGYKGRKTNSLFVVSCQDCYDFPSSTSPKMSEESSTPTLALVTGANKGIGLETSRQLASPPHNSHVLMSSRDPGRGEAATSTLRGSLCRTHNPGCHRR
jgi:hypothetical protein